MNFSTSQNRRRIFQTIGVVVMFLVGSSAFASYPSSTNYRIQMDVIDTGGGLATSSSYQSQSTIGETISGLGSGSAYAIKSGYQQMQPATLAISLPSSVTLTPAMPASGGGTSNGSANWTVTTDNVAGYSLSVRATTSPALVSGGNNFPDYTTAGANPDFTFTTPASASRFGFSPEGSDIVVKYRDNGATCNTGVSDTLNACWGPLSLVDEEVSRRTTPSGPSGVTTVLKFRAASDVANVQPGGVYSATAIVTAVAL